MIMNINWESIINESISGILSTVIATAITAAVGFLFIKKYTSQINFSNKMKNQGFINTTTNKISHREIKDLFKKAEEIKIIYVSGIRFLNINKKYLEDALNRGAKVKFLCCNPQSIFIKDIENMEYNYTDNSGKTIRNKEQAPISEEIHEVINNYQGKKGLEARFYSTEYRLPYIIAYYPDKSIKAWLTMTLPPYKSTKSFMLRGEKKKDKLYDDEINFIDMMEANFDTIWDNCSKSADEIINDEKKIDDELYTTWQNLYQKAKENMQNTKGKSGTLIEIAAQHPLVNGEKPNAEFEERLLLAIKIYNEESLKSNQTYLYVPGSIHMNNGVSDKISLSEAGKTFLIEHGIPKDHIFGNEMNIQYKGDQGVYNSSDECYVASKIFESKKFEKLHCVCSSGQMMRKALSYIRFGYVPAMHTVSCDTMYHNYIDEIFKNIPQLLKDDNALQGESEAAEIIRKERKPV